MLNELLINNKVVFAHVQRTIYGLNDSEDETEDYLFKTPSSKYHHSSQGEWLTLYDEKEDGEVDLRRGLPHFGIFDKNPFLYKRVSIPISIPSKDMDKEVPWVYSSTAKIAMPFYDTDKEILWAYSPEAKMLRISWNNKLMTFPLSKRKIKIEGMADEETVDEVIDVMLFFEDNEFLAKYRAELDSTDIPECDKCVDVKDPDDPCDLHGEELVKYHTSIADEFKRNKRYREAAKHYYKAYLVNEDDLLLVKVFNLVKTMERCGEDIKKLFAEMDTFRAPAFKFETDKEETSVGDVEFNNAGDGKGESSSDIPEVGQLKDNFKMLSNYVSHDLSSMSDDLQKSNIVSFSWQKLYKPDTVKITFKYPL